MQEKAKTRGTRYGLGLFVIVVALSIGWHLQIQTGTIDDGHEAKRFVRVYLPGTIPSIYLPEDTLITFTVYDRYGLRVLRRGAAHGPPRRDLCLVNFVSPSW
jgi:hypothetical protein